MARHDPAQDKTEQPTPRRLQEARRRGHVARSADLTGALSLLAVLAFFYAVKERLFWDLERFLKWYLQGFVTTEVNFENAGHLLLTSAVYLARVVGPLLLVAALVAALVNLVQVGFVFAPYQLRPDLERLNPLAGLSRLLSTRSLVELGKACFKFGVIGAVVYLVLRAELHQFFLLSYMAPGPAFLAAGRVVLKVAAWAGLAYLVLGLLDYLYQRHEYMRTMRMTRFELKEELRQTEGDPLVRARQRERQRQIALNRIRQEVPRATVVITNPVHLAVALRYVEGEMPAPRVVAKGAGFLAEQIRLLAARHNVPVVENPELARFLFYRVDVGREIPRELYQAVAEILAAVYRLPGRAAGA